MISVERLSRNSESEWESFVDAFVENAYAFSLEWRALLKQVFEYEDFCYLIKKNGSMVGVFPAYLVVSGLLGSRLISVPFADMGGLYFSPEANDTDKLEAFFLVKRRISDELRLSGINATGLEMRGPEKESNNLLLNNGLFTEVNPYVNLVINLKSSWEQIDNKISRNIKRNLGRSKGEIEVGVCDDVKTLPRLYKFYLAEMKRLGSPPLPEVFFSKMWEIFGRKKGFLVFTASYRKELIGGLFMLAFKDTIYADVIMSDPFYGHLFPKHHLYFSSLKHAWEDKRWSCYNFSRTRLNSGVFEHKRKWGGVIREVSYFYEFDGRGRNSFIDVSERRFLWFKFFLRACPISLLERLGPRLRKHAGK